LEPAGKLGETGIEVTMLPVDEHGMAQPEDLRSAMSASTALVSIMMANNEVGTINPIADLSHIAHHQGALFHTDAVQALGKIPIDVRELGVDLMSLSAHKIYGPKGIGALYIRKGTDIEPILEGGGQEGGRRPGTENVALAIGFAKAVEMVVASMEGETRRLRGLRDKLERRICERFPAAVINGHPTERLPHILNISFDNNRLPLEGEVLHVNMDLFGIAVASGSACTSGSIQPSHVLLAMGRDTRTARATLRFSFGKGNTMEDVNEAVDVLERVIKQMTQIATPA
jgi:cysteine desulfurase